MSKMQLTLFENDIVQISSSSIWEKTITDKQAEELMQWNSKLRANKHIDNDFFQYESKHTAKFINFVGAISLGDFQVNILPKIFKLKEGNSTENTQDAFFSFARIISYTLGIKDAENELLQFEKLDKIGLLELLVFFFAVSLKKALFEGIHFQYEQRILKSSYLTGKPLIERQMHEPDSSQIVQESYIYTENTELMQYFKGACSYFARIVRSDKLSRELRELSSFLVDIDTMPLRQIYLKKINLNRLNQHYKNPYDQSKLILDGLSINPDSTKSFQGVSILRDMSKIFETFFANFIKNKESIILPSTHTHSIKPQDSQHFLFINDKSRSLRPDICIESRNKNEKRTIILDTKYKMKDSEKKNLLSGVLSSDLYQMYAYSVKYNASDCILVYPSRYQTDDSAPHYFEDKNRLRIWKLNMNLKDGDWESKLANEIKPLMAKLFPER